MENGIVKRWDDMQLLWDYTFFEKMKIDPTGRKILLTEPPMNPLKNREHGVIMRKGPQKAETQSATDRPGNLCRSTALAPGVVLTAALPYLACVCQ